MPAFVHAILKLTHEFRNAIKTGECTRTVRRPEHEAGPVRSCVQSNRERRYRVEDLEVPVRHVLLWDQHEHLTVHGSAGDLLGRLAQAFAGTDGKREQCIVREFRAQLFQDAFDDQAG